jgi:hypothetical protein
MSVQLQALTAFTLEESLLTRTGLDAAPTETILTTIEKSAQVVNDAMQGNTHTEGHNAKSQALYGNNPPTRTFPDFPS